MMKNDNQKVHIEIHLSDLESNLSSLGENVEIYKLTSGMRSCGSVEPEVIMAVVTGGSIVIRQFIISLFDYLKSRQTISLHVQIGKKLLILKYADKSDETKVSTVTKAIKNNPKQVKITKKSD